MVFKLLTLALLAISYSEIDGAQLQFPDSFKFGAASAAYQVEGGWNSDGKGPNIWDTFTHNFPERIVDGSNGDDACLSYYVYQDDIDALTYLNAQFYRFSISWARVMSDGTYATRNQPGIDYYNKLINGLLSRGIEPMITLFHWDLPQALEDRGGFLSSDFPEWFEDYADLLFTEFGDRVKEWITFNEPLLFCSNGYAHNVWPPAQWNPGVGEYQCTHHTILAHARAYRLAHSKFADQNGKVGITINVGYAFPAEMDESHIAARDRNLEFNWGIYAHPLVHGDYPPVVRQRVDYNSALEGFETSRLPYFTSDEIEFIHGAYDFMGVNYYTSSYVMEATSDTFDHPSFSADQFTWGWIDESWPQAKSTWLRSIPEGLYQLLLWLRDHYNNVEIRITENGWSDEGELEDVGRITYLRDHFEAVHRAIQDGCNVSAHASWSIVDNFEWLQGYTEKFGIYRVDVEDPNRDRIVKDSVMFLQELFGSRVLNTD